MKCDNPDHRRKAIPKTEYNEACCPVQYLVDDTLFCPECSGPKVQYRLAHPIQNCRECEGTDMCPASEAARDAVAKNVGIRGAAKRKSQIGRKYPSGYTPQTYGEEEIAKKKSNYEIERAILEKENMKKNDPEGYAKKYHGSTGK